MEHFQHEAEINMFKRDAPITNAPVARWQRKAADTSMQNSSLNKSINQSFTKSPLKGVFNCSSTLTKSPKTPGQKPKNTTPSRSKTPKTPNGMAADRFIPNRAKTQFEIGYYKLTQQKENETEDESFEKKEYQRIMSENLNNGTDINNVRIIHYSNRAPLAPAGHLNNLRIIYSQTKTPGSLQKSTRHIPQAPERILDAPEIIDDYYLNLLDWSCNNHLALALGGHVYLWNAGSGEIQQLFEMEGTTEYVGALSWIKEGNYIAVGTSLGEVQLWDVEHMKRIRNMTGHTARVGALSWNSYILTSGSRSGLIHHHDVRIAEHNVMTLSAHSQEVCGLRWSPDGKYLASGANDNILNIWSATASNTTDSSPLFSLTQHQAAVKALAWCPWQPNILASGGGTADRTIRFWNCSNGACLQSVDTNSQVCSILWSKEYKELISSHGFANNQLIIWKYPSLKRITELKGHTARVLHTAMSPDGTIVASAAADETLRLWKCFAVDPKKKKEVSKNSKAATSILKQSIR